MESIDGCVRNTKLTTGSPEHARPHVSPPARFLHRHAGLVIALASVAGVALFLGATCKLYAVGEVSLRHLREAAVSSPPWTFLAALITFPGLVMGWYYRTTTRIDELESISKRLKDERERLEHERLRMQGEQQARAVSLYFECSAKLGSSNTLEEFIAGLLGLQSLSNEAPLAEPVRLMLRETLKRRIEQDPHNNEEIDPQDGEDIRVRHLLVVLSHLSSEHEGPMDIEYGQIGPLVLTNTQVGPLAATSSVLAYWRVRNSMLTLNAHDCYIGFVSVIQGNCALTLTGGRIHRLTFDAVNLSGSTFRDTEVENLEFRNCVLKDTLFSALSGGVTLRECDLSGADLRGIQWDNSDLSGSTYTETTRFPDGIDPREKGLVFASG